MSIVAFIAGGHTKITGAASGNASGARSGAGSATTNSVTAIPNNGSGNYDFSWSCSGGITCDSATSQTTTFSKTLANGEAASGTATCTVTDRATGDSIPITCSVTLTSTNTDLVAHISPSSVWRSGMAPSSGPYTDAFLAVVDANGTGSYSYSWSVVSGLGATIVGSSTSASCTFSYNAGPEASGYGTTVQCLITDTGNAKTATPQAAILQDPGH